MKEIYQKRIDLKELPKKCTKCPHLDLIEETLYGFDGKQKTIKTLSCEVYEDTTIENPMERPAWCPLVEIEVDDKENQNK